MYFGQLLDIFLGEIVAIISAIAQQADGAGGGKAFASGLRVRVTEGRVGLDAHAHGLVDGYGPGCGYGVSGHQNEPFEAVGFHHGPFDGLKTAHRAAYKYLYPANAERFGKDAVGVDNVADGVGWEIFVVG